jgi:hypothetical protein
MEVHPCHVAPAVSTHVAELRCADRNGMDDCRSVMARAVRSVSDSGYSILFIGTTTAYERSQAGASSIVPTCVKMLSIRRPI